MSETYKSIQWFTGTSGLCGEGKRDQKGETVSELKVPCKSLIHVIHLAELSESFGTFKFL